MILIGWGTRPESIKLGPIAACLTDRYIPWIGLCTGQHTDLLRGTPAESDLQDSESLNLPSDGNIPRWLTEAERATREWLSTHPEIQFVVVQGDTMSALAVARAAVGMQRTVCHVEAGIRSGDLQNPWPEEETRIEITTLADWHYAPTPRAFTNLLHENISPHRIRMTGNPVVSALARYSTASPSVSLGHVLITLHRREFIQSPTFLDTINTLLNCISLFGQVEFYWPLHPAVRALLEPRLTEVPANLFLCDPMPYADATRMLATARGTLTDSGGIQEEAATLGVPCAVLRYTSDRPESLFAGVAKLFPPTPEGVSDAVQCIVKEQLARIPTALYGSVKSAEMIALHLADLHAAHVSPQEVSADLG